MQKFVITHPEMGIYVGNAMGMGFWSNLDAVGQDSVPVFDTAEEARSHVSEWDDHNDPDGYGYESVEVTDEATFATADELKEAGLSGMLGELVVTVGYRGCA
jgi:hypothetical protein